MYHPYTVYLIINTLNNKKYVGYTKRSLKENDSEARLQAVECV